MAEKKNHWPYYPPYSGYAYPQNPHSPQYQCHPSYQYQSYASSYYPYYACTSDHDGKNVGLSQQEQHHHHRHGYHYHQAYPQPPTPAQPYHQPTYPQYYPVQYPQAQYTQQHSVPYPVTPPPGPKSPKRPKPSDVFHYVPPGVVPGPEAAGKNIWHGRTRQEVAEDAHRTAKMTGLYGPHEFKPRNANPEDMFTVMHPDGFQTNVSFATIDKGGWKGHWGQDMHGRMYFNRTDPYQGDSD